MDHPKGQFVTSYLTKEFPGKPVTQSEWLSRDSWVFRIDLIAPSRGFRRGEDQTRYHRVLVVREYLDDTPGEDIGAALRARGLAQFLKQSGEEWVTVEDTGLHKGLLSDYAVTFRLPGDPVVPAYTDGPNRTVVKARSPDQARAIVLAGYEGAEVCSVKLLNPE